MPSTAPSTSTQDELTTTSNASQPAFGGDTVDCASCLPLYQTMTISPDPPASMWSETTLWASSWSSTPQPARTLAVKPILYLRRQDPKGERPTGYHMLDLTIDEAAALEEAAHRCRDNNGDSLVTQRTSAPFRIVNVPLESLCQYLATEAAQHLISVVEKGTKLCGSTTNKEIWPDGGRSHVSAESQSTEQSCRPSFDVSGFVRMAPSSASGSGALLHQYSC
ncbi:uncharacterized protein MKK02DRAFT_39437 [Dioszegia hungarica]|uniref:Uncharacterized protein n=1 Tax=Dioszegia hungarica TaxID=4972 RepID=A0AA38LX25_9TREE|nr:uncharacterized protein MKK02DRAFT_39437 [Dioszegia hungarica]KAI9639150.1 hypothetical protein MKK02DRAFT_39437 [Dioszegia hungarica]